MEDRLSRLPAYVVEAASRAESATWTEAGLLFVGMPFDLGHRYGVGVSLNDGRSHAELIADPTPLALDCAVDRLRDWAHANYG